ncbi:hypothetical protein LPTSP3_g27330 [Leptospira kobayashii]|uniref:Uncharacterized protein n=1 Tax=Leptospira kobayashii TaxID=1917830 RepID=A0ABM7UT53_9LEPT|nr:hypothetical protein LPTSP3_g27330 [Leptospira kobayashii]
MDLRNKMSMAKPAIQNRIVIKKKGGTEFNASFMATKVPPQSNAAKRRKNSGENMRDMFNEPCIDLPNRSRKT